MAKIRVSIYIEAFRMAVQALQAQLLRAILTALIIAIGITALVGMLTATSVMEASISGQFTSMGANTFTIQQGGMNIQIGRNGIKEKQQPQIPLRTALKLREALSQKGIKASVSDDLVGTAVVFYEGQETNPNVRVMAADQNYAEVNALTLSSGRYFSPIELREARAVALIAPDVVAKLFPDGQALGKRIRVSGNKPYTVIGITAPKGNSGFMASDNLVYLPLMTGHQDFGSGQSSYVTSIISPSPSALDATMDEAIASMRALRKLRPGKENNFNIRRSDSLSSMLIESLSSVSMGAALIGFITLLGASVALMNIMLVSVTERTREIGTRKALGANQRIIVLQFLAEAILVSVMGGILGTVLGLFVGNALALAMDSPAVFPLQWMILALVVSVLVGIISGWYPARQAAKLDPIEALRYE
ncbi:MAG: ABC transporter permease [Cryomorphaceae bacterium]|jgi:putative ABC transport system permease protein|nr:ABC transporter permease [Cryomorphaceae bacterium]